MVLTGCASGGGVEGSTTTSSATAEPVNPWDLPLEQRPALFDPCTELPVEAVEQGLGGPVEKVNLYERNRPGELMACGWATDQAEISVLATWKPRYEYIKDRSLKILDLENNVDGRTGMRLVDNTAVTERSCIQLFFTERGTIWLRLDLLDFFREFRGERPTEPCGALEQAIPPIMAHYPQGEFK
ncbi:DUF3558 family protein [Dietzia alimentaria]|uniref:DUF3558 family protein n=1 Tax=Dietzia alimentaria TaxID=665550 RepID=UPI003B75C167